MLFEIKFRGSIGKILKILARLKKLKFYWLLNSKERKKKEKKNNYI